MAKTLDELFKFSQMDEVWLNDTTRIIMMRPNDDIYLKFAKRIGEALEIIFNRADENKKEESKTPWIEDEEKYDFVMETIKKVLMYAIRVPENYRMKLLVDEGEPLQDGQEYYEDFNPALDIKKIEEQGYYTGLITMDKKRILTPKLVLFFAVLRNSGWMGTPEDAEAVDSFPEEQKGDEETTDSGTLREDANGDSGPEPRTSGLD